MKWKRNKAGWYSTLWGGAMIDIRKEGDVWVVYYGRMPLASFVSGRQREILETNTLVNAKKAATKNANNGTLI